MTKMRQPPLGPKKKVKLQSQQTRATPLQRQLQSNAHAKWLQCLLALHAERWVSKGSWRSRWRRCEFNVRKSMYVKYVCICLYICVCSVWKCVQIRVGWFVRASVGVKRLAGAFLLFIKCICLGGFSTLLNFFSSCCPLLCVASETFKK